MNPKKDNTIPAPNTYCMAKDIKGHLCHNSIPVTEKLCDYHKRTTLWCKTCDLDIGHGDASQFSYVHIAAKHDIEVRDVRDCPAS